MIEHKIAITVSILVAGLLIWLIVEVLARGAQIKHLEKHTAFLEKEIARRGEKLASQIKEASRLRSLLFYKDKDAKAIAQIAEIIENIGVDELTVAAEDVQCG